MTFNKSHLNKGILSSSNFFPGGGQLGDKGKGTGAAAPCLIFGAAHVS